MRNRYRLKFTKSDRIRFIGHLDLCNVFQRSVKRSGLPISYSNGFNPHQIISFGLPLSLGYKSVGEYVDIQLDEDINLEEIKSKLNKTLPHGLEIIDIKKLLEEEKNSASILVASTYEVIVNIDNLIEIANEFYNQNEILIAKKTKRSNDVVDIKKDIFDFKTKDDKTLIFTISSGSSMNLKADLVVEALYKYANVNYDKHTNSYTRIELLHYDSNNILTSLI